jgi:uncharacterized membrane protein YkvA (DUF1232 family)
MLTRWRVLSISQCLLGGPTQDLEEVCQSALEAFAREGPTVPTNIALQGAAAEIKRLAPGVTHSVLPVISPRKRAAVVERLGSISAGGATSIQHALSVLQSVREGLNQMSQVVPLPGIQLRLEAAAAILLDEGQPEVKRVRAASAILYVHEVHDVIPDTLGVMGMLDDDYALRVVLEEIGGGGVPLHWSERISSIWDDLPFLQGVNLLMGTSPVGVTWLDRVNSYVSYTHVLREQRVPLLLLQPSVACSPLHPIVSLAGLLVLDSLTSSQTAVRQLRVDQTYEIDGYFARFGGTDDPPTPGWLRLQFRDGILYQPPAVQDRMIPVASRRLSALREFLSRPRAPTGDPAQRFFDWDTAISPASFSSQIILVTSRLRALDLLDGIQSNGVRLLDHGLVRFVGASVDELETHGTLLLVAPSLSAVRMILDKGVQAQTILVDGYTRLRRGRHDLPFIASRPAAPPIIIWSATGYYPAHDPPWIPPHRRLEVSPRDLTSILELDYAIDSMSAEPSLRQAATGPVLHPRLITPPADEVSVVNAVDTYLRALNETRDLPEYWRYQLAALGRVLRLLIIATPVEWAEVRRFASAWTRGLDDRWTSLRPGAVAELAPLRTLERQIERAINEIQGELNSRAAALSSYFLDADRSPQTWYFVCDRPEQVRAAGNLFRSRGIRGIEPALIRDLPVCSACVVAGWTTTSFARRLWAHTPSLLVQLVDEAERQRWERAASSLRREQGASILDAVAGTDKHTAVEASAPRAASNSGQVADVERADDSAPLVPCVFLWLAGESEVKVLTRVDRVVVEEGDQVRERPAAMLQTENRVILAAGAGRWSPAEEFTQAVVNAVEASHPDLVRNARDWRRALRKLREELRLSTAQLRERLAAVGVLREVQTLEGWLEVERASPIAPMRVRRELEMLWPLIGRHAKWGLEEVVSACSQLRSLRVTAGHALLRLWKGRVVDLGLDEAWVDGLVDRLKQEVQVFEIEAVTTGKIPAAMMGWWISPELAEQYESDDGDLPPDGDHDRDSDAS